MENLNTNLFRISYISERIARLMLFLCNFVLMFGILKRHLSIIGIMSFLIIQFIILFLLMLKDKEYYGLCSENLVFIAFYDAVFGLICQYNTLSKELCELFNRLSIDSALLFIGLIIGFVGAVVYIAGRYKTGIIISCGYLLLLLRFSNNSLVWEKNGIKCILVFFVLSFILTILNKYFHGNQYIYMHKGRKINTVGIGLVNSVFFFSFMILILYIVYFPKKNTWQFVISLNEWFVKSGIEIYAGALVLVCILALIFYEKRRRIVIRMGQNTFNKSELLNKERSDLDFYDSKISIDLYAIICFCLGIVLLKTLYKFYFIGNTIFVPIYMAFAKKNYLHSEFNYIRIIKLIIVYLLIFLIDVSLSWGYMLTAIVIICIYYLWKIIFEDEYFEEDDDSEESESELETKIDQLVNGNNESFSRLLEVCDNISKKTSSWIKVLIDIGVVSIAIIYNSKFRGLKDSLLYRYIDYRYIIIILMALLFSVVTLLIISLAHPAKLQKSPLYNQVICFMFAFVCVFLIRSGGVDIVENSQNDNTITVASQNKNDGFTDIFISCYENGSLWNMSEWRNSYVKNEKQKDSIVFKFNDENSKVVLVTVYNADNKVSYRLLFNSWVKNIYVSRDK